MPHRRYISELQTFLPRNVVLRSFFAFLYQQHFNSQEYSVIFLISITEIQVEGTPASPDAGNDNESKTSCSCNFSLVPNECLSYP